MNINKNYAWTATFVKRLEKLGVRDVCLSPGSRNTPLTLAFASSRKIKSHLFIDERASAFFALGIAKASRTPTAIVTTSGTATAELYPAIIEAYQTRVPLIVCTADRPEYLRNSGANQTINQENLYKNHIRFYHDMRLPKLNKSRLQTLVRNTDRAYFTSSIINPGPVHLNFPFEKPLEPESKDVQVDENLLTGVLELPIAEPKKIKIKLSGNYIEKILKTEKTLILAGAVEKNKEGKAILQLAGKLKSPIVADGTSSLRYFKKNENIISTATSLFKNMNDKSFEPEVIIQFGKAPTTNSVLSFFENSTAVKILFNKFGDLHDPSLTYNKLITADAPLFTNEISKLLKGKNIKRSGKFLSLWKERESKINRVRKAFLDKCRDSFEGKAVAAIFEALPEKSNLFVGNSTPPRDVDLFSEKNKKGISIFSNRGASGIDGIISTAGGVAVKSNAPVFLLIGDVSFLYDVTALGYLAQKGVNLTVILFNNNGGGIFTMLPIYKEKKFFDKYFRTPHGFEFDKIVESLHCGYSRIEKLNELKSKIRESVTNGGVNVLEIFTDAEYSKECREKFYSEIAEIVND